MNNQNDFIENLIPEYIRDKKLGSKVSRTLYSVLN